MAAYSGNHHAPLRIGIFTDTYAPQVNGVAVSLQLVVQGLREAGHEVTVFAPRFPGYKDKEPKVYRIPSLKYINKPPIYVAVPGTPRTTWSLHRSRFDVLHAHSPLTVGLLAYITASARSLPLIYTYHTSITDYTHYIKVVGGTPVIRRAARWFSTATTNLGSQIVVPSPKFERMLLSQKVRRPIHVIPNGIDLSSFQKAKAPGIFRQRLGLGPDARVLLYVGRLGAEKRVDFLIEAFARLAARDARAHFVLAGDGNARAKLDQQAAATGYGNRIRFLGVVNRSDLTDLLHDADLFLSASTTETQCLAMVEAIASGLPVVAVWDDAFEGILVDEVNGFATDLDAEAFSAAAARLLNDSALRRTFSRNSSELSRKFSIESQVSALAELYAESIAAAREAV
jgi:1,2-diacylglycerol 3-alpha-glucosyltransferase